MGADNPRRTAVALRDAIPWHDLVQVALTAEDTGYEAVFVPEIAGREAFATLAGLAGRTSRLRLGTGVVPITARTPQATAMAAVTVHEASGGRLILGIGSGRPDRPVERVRAYAAILREALAGKEVWAEDPYPVDGFRLWLGPHPQPIPIWLAALGPRMLATAGAIADGVLLNWCTPERVAHAAGEVRGAAERAGRDPDSVAVAVYVRACLGADEEHAVPVLKEAAAEYAALPHYRRLFEAMGLGAEAGRAADALAAGTPEAVPDAFVDGLCVRGSREAALRQLGAYHDAGADVVVVYPVPALEPVSSITGTVLAAAPSTAVER